MLIESVKLLFRCRNIKMDYSARIGEHSLHVLRKVLQFSRSEINVLILGCGDFTCMCLVDFLWSQVCVIVFSYIHTYLQMSGTIKLIFCCCFYSIENCKASWNKWQVMVSNGKIYITRNCHCEIKLNDLILQMKLKLKDVREKRCFFQAWYWWPRRQSLNTV